MRNLYRLLILLVLCVACFGAEEKQNVILQHFPNRQDLGILCWSVSEEGAGYLSQIVVFQTDSRGNPRVLWQSPLEYAYFPRIQFVQEIVVDGLPLAFVERQSGAALSQLDVIGKTAGRVVRLLTIDGSKFDIERLDGSKLPLIIAHKDTNILDVPDIYRWNGSHFAEDSASHPDYYRRLLAEDKAKLPAALSGVVSVKLSRIAVLSGNRSEAKAILEEALSKERNKGDTANKETLRLITEAVHALADGAR